MTALQWVAVDLLTGSIVCDLPSVALVQGAFRTGIGVYNTQTVSLVVTDTIDPSWLTGTEADGSKALIAYRGAPGYEVVQWGGIITRRQRDVSSQSSNVVSLSLVTPEGYLDRRYVGDYTATNKDQNTIATDLVTRFAQDAGSIPISVNVTGSAGTARTRSYADKDDATVYARLQELMGVQGGPEWVMGWSWTHGPEKITPTFTVGTRIGNPVIPGLAPAATFEVSQDVTLSYAEDFSSGKGATVLTATATGQGNARPEATAQLASFTSQPKYEHRFTPSTSISDTTTLGKYAAQALAGISGGTRSVTFAAAVTAAPKLGVEWGLGDDIGYVITGSLFPTPISGIARCIGYEVTDTTVAPILQGADL